jgi:hypothetical protein
LLPLFDANELMPPRSEKPKPCSKPRTASKAKAPKAKDVEKALELKRECQSLGKITHALNAGEQAVAGALRQLEQHAHADLIADTAAVKARQTAQLERVVEEALSAWLHSKKRGNTTRTRTKSAPGKDQRNEIKEKIRERTLRSQSGTASYLAEARAALADIRKLWGLDGKSATFADLDPTDPEVAEAAIAAALAVAHKKNLSET